LGKYTNIAKTYFARALNIQADIYVLILTNFITISSVVFIWVSILSDKGSIAGYTLSDTVIYYLLALYIGIITYTNSVDNISFAIKNGSLSEQLLKPRNIILSQMARVFGDQLFKLIITSPFVLIAFVIVSNLMNISFSFDLKSVFALSVGMVITILGLILGVLMDIAIGAIGFWLDEVWALKHAQVIVSDLLSGKRIPLAFFPPVLLMINNLLPIRFTISTPVEYFMQKRGPNDIMFDLLCLTVWLLFFIVFTSFIFKKGLKKYGAFGS
jgi:ABC-2 type transport system permease protein